MHALISTLWGRMSRTTATGPHRIAASIRRGPVLWLTVCGGFLVAAIIIGTIAMVSEFRERALTNGERELENTVFDLPDADFRDCFARGVQGTDVHRRGP